LALNEQKNARQKKENQNGPGPEERASEPTPSTTFVQAPSLIWKFVARD